MGSDHELGILDNDCIIALIEDELPEVKVFRKVPAAPCVHIMNTQRHEWLCGSRIGIPKKENLAFTDIIINAVSFPVPVVPARDIINRLFRIEPFFVYEAVKGSIRISVL